MGLCICSPGPEDPQLRKSAHKTASRSKSRSGLQEPSREHSKLRDTPWLTVGCKRSNDFRLEFTCMERFDVCMRKTLNELMNSAICLWIQDIT